MTLAHRSTADISASIAAARAEATQAPRIESRPWGYALCANGGQRAGLIASIGGRFFGSILLISAAGFWLMPDALVGAEVLGIKLAATVMFTLFGAWLVWAGRRGMCHEVEIDMMRGEVRLGTRDLRGGFHLRHVLSFSAVSLVYLLRSTDRETPTRLYLRLAGSAEAINVAEGDGPALERLRERLAHDLAQDPSRARPMAAHAPRALDARRPSRPVALI